MASNQVERWEFKEEDYNRLLKSIDRLYQGPDLGNIMIILRVDEKTSRRTLMSDYIKPNSSGRTASDYEWAELGDWLRDHSRRPLPKHFDVFGWAKPKEITYTLDLPTKDDLPPRGNQGNHYLRVLLALISKGTLTLPTLQENGLLFLELQDPEHPVSHEAYVPWDKVESEEFSFDPAAPRKPTSSEKGKQPVTPKKNKQTGPPPDPGSRGSTIDNPVDIEDDEENPDPSDESSPGNNQDKGKGKEGEDSNPFDSSIGGSGGGSAGGSDVGGSSSKKHEQNEQAMIEAIGIRPKLEDDTFWHHVCEFFMKDTTDLDNTANASFRIPGLEVELFAYQAAMVLWVLIRYPDAAISAAGIADQMGLGKTFMCIATMVIFNHVCEAKHDVESNGKLMGRRHLGIEAPPGSMCPSQTRVTAIHGIQCPCVRGSWSQRIADAIHDLPSVIIVPPKLLTVWIAEWEKFVDPAGGMQLRVQHKDYVKHAKYGLVDLVQLVQFASSVDNVITDKAYAVAKRKHVTQRNGFQGGSSRVILASSATAEKLLDPFDAPKRRLKNDDGENVLATENKLACSFVFFDEMHDYRGGSITDKTSPFRFLEKVALNNSGPTMAVCVSGSMLTMGPEAWGPMVHHIFRSSNRPPSTVSLASLTRENYYSGFPELVAAWKYVSQRLGSPDAENDEKYNNSLNRLKRICKDMFPKLIIKRTQTDTFRGAKLFEPPTVTKIRTGLELEPGGTQRCIARLCRNVRTFLENGDHDTEVLFKQAKALKGPVQKHCGNHYYTLMEATSYPFIARLQTVFREKSFSAEEVQKTALKYTRLFDLQQTDRRKLLGCFRDTPIWEYRKHIATKSPKYMHLERLVRELRTLKSAPAGKQPDKGPADGSNVRHMVIFTETPLAALITAMFLTSSFRDIDVLLFHGDLPMTSTVKKHPHHSREAFIEYFHQDCSEGDNNKILVGTYSLLSTGLNLQLRASSAVFMDVATETLREQSAGRFQRLGQRQPVTIHELYSLGNLFEAHRIKAIQDLHDIPSLYSLWSMGHRLKWSKFHKDEEDESDYEEDEADSGSGEGKMGRREREYSPESGLTALSSA